MGNKINDKVEKAKIENSENLEELFFLEANKGEKDLADKHRLKFISNLAEEILNLDLPFSNPEFFKLIEQVKDVEENSKKIQEDKAILKSKKYFGEHMNNFGRVVTIGANSIQKPQFQLILARTAAFASSFTLVGLSLSYLVSGIFDNESSKMKKYTQKIAINLRKEVDVKVFQQTMDDFYANISSIQKMFQMIVNLVNMTPADEKEGELKSNQENQIMISLLQICDVIYEKIKQKKVFFKFSFYFIEAFYNFAIFHCSITKTAVITFGYTIYENQLKLYIEDYVGLFKEYVLEAKNMRKDSFTITQSESSFNIATKIIANQHKIYEYLIDEFNGESLLATEKSIHTEGVFNANFISGISKAYHDVNMNKPIFYDLKVILPILK